MIVYLLVILTPKVTETRVRVAACSPETMKSTHFSYPCRSSVHSQGMYNVFLRHAFSGMSSLYCARKWVQTETIHISICNILVCIIKETHAEHWSRQAMGTRAALSSVWDAVVEEGIVLILWSRRTLGRSENLSHDISTPTQIQLNFSHKPTRFFASARHVLRCQYSFSFHTGVEHY